MRALVERQTDRRELGRDQSAGRLGRQQQPKTIRAYGDAATAACCRPCSAASSATSSRAPSTGRSSRLGSASPGSASPAPHRGSSAAAKPPGRYVETGKDRMAQAEIHGPGDGHSGPQEPRIDRRRISPDPARILLLQLANPVDEPAHGEVHRRTRPTGPVEPGHRHTGTVGRNDDVHPMRVVKRPSVGGQRLHGWSGSADAQHLGHSPQVVDGVRPSSRAVRSQSGVAPRVAVPNVDGGHTNQQHLAGSPTRQCSKSSSS